MLMLGVLPVMAFAQTFDFDLTKSQPVYTTESGFGYDILPAPTKQRSNEPFYFSVKVDDGNYRIKVELGSKKRVGETTVRAEGRRLMVHNVATKKGKFVTYEFVVNKRSPRIDDKSRVRIKEREKDYNTWNDSLDLFITGASPAVSRIVIEPAPEVNTLYLCGNSTVTDQPYDPYASWGQMIPRWFGDSMAVSNHAESGLTARTFIASNRLNQICATLKEGDYVICEFGHNDEKEHQPGDGAWYHYIYNLKVFVDRVRDKGATIIFCTPTSRRFFNDDQKTLKNTHGDFPAAMLSVAEREQVPVIDLNGMTKTFFEALGFEDSKRSLVHYAANTFPDQTKDLADNTHFNPYGAYEVAKMVVQGFYDMQLPITRYLRTDWKPFNAAMPDSWQDFKWTFTRRADATKPDGN